MTSDTVGALYRQVGAFTAQLRHSGVEHVVICPGSRSTPLTLAFARDQSIRSWLHLDERAAGYFALGLARQIGAPVAVVTTSGTAAANLLPAAAEASLSRVPLLFLTADRPPELRDVGANQTIDQVHLFGSHARWFAELPVADPAAPLEDHARSVAARAAAAAMAEPRGPVQVNLPFREPLVGPGWELALEAAAKPAAIDAPQASSPDAARAARQLIEAVVGRRGIILCGPESAGLPAEPIVRLARALGWPVLADPLSGLRAGSHGRATVVECYDALLRIPGFAAELRPEAVLRLGAHPTSKLLGQLLAELRDVPQVLVDPSGAWRDPDACATLRLPLDPAALCEAAAATLEARRPSTFNGAADDPARTAHRYTPDPAWLERWTAANAAARTALDGALDDVDEPFEAGVPIAVARALPDGATLVLGNSMLVRDADACFPATGRRLRLLGTRGASGIDGVLSTAVGAAAAGLGPVALLIGDISFLHDLTGLWALRRHDLSLLVVLVNNDGGGIFHFLPQRDAAPEEFEPWFGTPHGLDFRGAIEMFGGTLLRPDYADLEATLRDAVDAPGLTVVEVRTDRERNVVLHRELWARVEAAVRERSLAPAPASARSR